jgi:phosphate transport system protein
MQRHFETEIEELRASVLKMGGLVQKAIHLSVASLDKNTADAAEATNEVIERIEPLVNDLHREIDQRAFDLLALQQVMAVDLRFVTAASRIGNDLERMADRAVNIARRAISILTLPNPKSLIQIPRMAEAVETMVANSMEAFALRDEALARSVLQQDREVDQYRDEVFQELVDEATAETRFIQPALDLILISRNLERIADHSTNVAESVVFMVLGQDIRHRYNVPSSTNEPLG